MVKDHAILHVVVARVGQVAGIGAGLFDLVGGPLAARGEETPLSSLIPSVGIGTNGLTPAAPPPISTNLSTRCG